MLRLWDFGCIEQAFICSISIQYADRQYADRQYADRQYADRQYAEEYSEIKGNIYLGENV